jgi:hypothetical protein
MGPFRDRTGRKMQIKAADIIIKLPGTNQTYAGISSASAHPHRIPISVMTTEIAACKMRGHYSA